MRQIINITAEPIQNHTILFEESEITLILRFYPRSEIWVMDVEFLGWAVYGIKLSAGVLHITSQNQAFDFLVQDTSGAGIDPFQRQDFATGRCVLYILDADEMEQIRGAEVPI